MSETFNGQDLFDGGRQDGSPRDGFLIVGIGASAGGIDALKAFFACVSRDSGAAYVVILHLSPDHESRLADVLQSVSAMPVMQVRERMRVEPDRVYVIPPNQSLSMDDGHLEVSDITRIEERRAPIDIFFRTLAESHHSRAVCVVLSGMGADGSMGLKRVKENGGICIAQEPGEAAYSDMPRHAIATRLVDEVLPAAEIPAKIAAYKRHRATVENDLQERAESDDRALREILTALRMRTGHDFANYKPSTVLRRIERRIAVLELADLAAYAAYFREEAEEARALLKDLLISVTNFFRDPGAFAALERNIIPRLFENKETDDSVRVWIAGCATGEEVYSIAMLLCEHAQAAVGAPKVQVFATDIDEWALGKARAGLYSESDVADVSPERLKQFFVKERDGYRVRAEMREMVLFANHNVIRHPPYSRLDLVACRNLLIYMNRAAQERLMEVFHFALNPGAYLFLGASESTAGAGNSFAPVDKDAHIFQSRSMERRAALAFSSPNIVAPAAPLRKPEGDRHDWAAPNIPSYQALHQRLLEQYAPPSVVIDEKHEVVHLSELAGRYMQVPGGEPSTQLLRMVRPELRLPLRTALHQATRNWSPVEMRGLAVQIDGETERVDLIVRPAPSEQDASRGFILVLFAAGGSAIETEVDAALAVPAAEPFMRQVEDELVRVKAQLHATGEQHELQEEELRASNEELQSINEELRSASEELETSKEELQSFNEELTTLNQELKVKIDELTQANNDSRNLMNATDTAIVFVDRQLRVKLFTPRAQTVFNLIPADVGRPLLDITHRLADAPLMADIASVLDTLRSVERGVTSSDGNSYIARVLPYRTADDRIDGVVLTFTDITGRKRAEDALRATDEQFRRAIEDAPIPVIMHAEDGEVLQISRTWTDLTGYGLRDVPTVQAWLNHAYGEGAEAVRDYMRDLFRGGGPQVNVEFSINTRDNGLRRWSFSASSPGKLRDGRAYIVGMAVDITERTRIEDALRESEARYRRLFDSMDEGFCVIEMQFDDHGKPSDYVFLEVNAAFEKQTGLQQAVGKRMRELIPEHEAHWFDTYGRVAMTGEPVRFEAPAQGLRRFFDVYASRTDGAEARRVAVVFTDITERKRGEEALRRSEERLRLTLESVTDYAILTTDVDGRIETWNVGAERIFGYTEAEARGQHVEMIFTPEDREQCAPAQEMRVAREKGAAADERWHVRKSGERFFASGVLAPVRDGGRLLGYSKVAQDLTARRAAEEALRQAREDLEARVQERTSELAQANEALRLEVLERRQSEGMRMRLLGQLVDAQENERRRISRELHDQFGQQVSALGIKLSALKAAHDLTPAVREELEDLETIATQLDSDVDFLVWELRPTALDDLGLFDALSDYVASWSKHFGVAARLHASGMDKTRLSGDIETVLYRVTQEGLNNIAKHAGARQVNVILERRPDQTSLTIADDGVGFDAGEVDTGAKGLGLIGIRERVALAGGTVLVESQPGKGTTVFVRMPVTKTFAEDAREAEPPAS